MRISSVNVTKYSGNTRLQKFSKIYYQERQHVSFIEFQTDGLKIQIYIKEVSCFLLCLVISSREFQKSLKKTLLCSSSYPIFALYESKLFNKSSTISSFHL